jgi:regulatory protein
MAGGSRARGQGGDEQPEDPVQRAKDICLRLLTVRARTRAELEQALVRKGIKGDVVETVLGRLGAIGLIDDKGFAEVWVRSRHAHDGLGRRALTAQLRRKGVDEAVTADAVAAIDYGAEEERARMLVRKKLRALTGVDDAARVRRLVGMLARKGYSQGMSYRVVRDELRAAGVDSEVLDDGPLD